MYIDDFIPIAALWYRLLDDLDSEMKTHASDFTLHIKHKPEVFVVVDAIYSDIDRALHTYIIHKDKQFAYAKCIQLIDETGLK